MAWQNEMTNIVRNLVNDVDAELYSDSRVEQVILVAAQLIINKAEFPNEYSIDVDLLSLSPDPTLTSPKDNDFINIVSVQAAVIILKGEAKTLAAQSYKITDGPSSIDVSSAYKALQEQAKAMQDTLDVAIMDYVAGNSVGACVILTPYTYASNYRGYYNNYYER